MSQFFEILIFSQDAWGKVHYVREINLISEGTLMEAFISRAKQIKRNLRQIFVDKRQLKIIMRKNKLSFEYTLYLFVHQSYAFFQIFLPRKSNFWERQLFLIVTIWHVFRPILDAARY